VPFSAGDRVTVRGECWIVEEATAFSEATLLKLCSADGRATPRFCHLLAPFDAPVPTRRSARIRAITRRRWMHHLHAEVSALRAFGELRGAQQADIDLLPFQLEPALALVRGDASRFLLADEVGLGKTIQAGLMLSELLHRGWCDRALIVTPPGLRQQWADELLHRFRMQAALIDAASLAARACSLPCDVNPWAVEPVTIASIDFIKQPEVLRGLASLSWDALIVDEAHQATVASLRYDAVSELARRARHVVLLTATPHAGDERAYRALCEIGSMNGEDPILRFRRTRELTGLPRSRRVHLLAVKATPAGVEMHRLLDEYLAQLWTIARSSNRRDVQLVAMVLAKRAFSSARSLATSLERRMAALTSNADEPTQAALPLGLDDDLSDEPPVPIARAFAHPDQERAIVQRIIDAARRTQDDDRKMHVLRRIVRRVREPLIIFTEYRDTLEAICGEIGGLRHITTLHGGHTALERRQSLHAFANGRADVMIATDAGSVGLNLQGNCRLVVNLELPWNPVRLEQRIGRVDRIGQTHTVHAINLLAGDTAERAILANLLRRIDRIRMSEIDIAACVINRMEPPSQPSSSDTCTRSVDVSAAASAEAHRVSGARRFGAVHSTLSDQTVPLTVVRSAPSALTSFFRVRLVTGAGRSIENALVPVRMPINAPRTPLTRRDARALAESLTARFGAELARHAKEHADRRARAIAQESAHSMARAVRRERAIADILAPHGLRLVQAGLFDRRALKEKWAEESQHDLTRRESEARADLLEADSSALLAHDPELAMLLLLCSPA
jgi:superfamily II DNA or RNA helicase